MFPNHFYSMIINIKEKKPPQNKSSYITVIHINMSPVLKQQKLIN